MDDERFCIECNNRINTKSENKINTITDNMCIPCGDLYKKGLLGSIYKGGKGEHDTQDTQVTQPPFQVTQDKRNKYQK